MMILHGYKHHAEVESKGITDNERHQQKKFPSGKNYGMYNILLLEKNDQVCDCSLSYEL